MAVFVNCANETKIFEEMLLFKNEARLLVVHDATRRGKTTLLQRLWQSCRWADPAIPAVLVRLNELGNPDPLVGPSFLVRIQQDLLNLFEVQLSTFDRLNRARLNFDFSPFSAGSASGVVSASGAFFSGGVVSGQIGTVINAPNAERVNAPPPPAPRETWASPEQEDQARQGCYTAFFEDLKQISDSRSVVILLDEWNGGVPHLLAWIQHRLVEPYCLDVARRPKQLLVAIAGENPPEFDFLPPAWHQKLIHVIKPLGPWDEDHVREFVMDLHPQIKDDEFTVIRRKIIEDRVSLEIIKELIKFFRN